MANLQELKTRINSIKSISKITKAMNLIATSKFQLAKKVYQQNKVFYLQVLKTFSSIYQNINKSLFFKRKDKTRTIYLVISSDFGMCGLYNRNIFKLAKENIKENDLVFTIGLKIYYFLKKNKIGQIVNQPIAIGEKVKFNSFKKMTSLIIEQLTKFKNLKIISTNFINNIKFESQIVDVFNSLDQAKLDSKIECEIEPEEMFEKNLFFLINSVLHYSLLESKLAENAARRNAMDMANNNAIELSNDLLLKFNQERQANITREIIEIIGGLE